ncbi:MAG: hypothetical protein AB7R90_04040 [Reyranellaceae bacterium]
MRGKKGRQNTGQATQLEAVWQVMQDRQWHTLAEIAEQAGCPQASASARLRDLRKSAFGARRIERQYVGPGLYRYCAVDAPLPSVSHCRPGLGAEDGR